MQGRSPAWSPVVAVTNPFRFTNGRNRESDPNFRARLKAFIQSISRGTKTALEGFARLVTTTDGRRVLFARAVEPVLPTGTVQLFIDDGSGTIEEFDDSFITTPDTIIASAAGGEVEFFTSQKPIRDDLAFTLYINAAALTRGTDYVLEPTEGQIVLDSTVYPTGLTASDTVTAEYRYYTGLIQATQRLINGDQSDPLRYPGVKAEGIQVIVQAPTVLFQTVTASIAVLDGFDPVKVAANVSQAIQDYINSLGIGENVIYAELIQRAMDVAGMYNITVTDLSGSAPVDQTVADYQVARITSSDISLI
jgi:hypothetical protein